MMSTSIYVEVDLKKEGEWEIDVERDNREESPFMDAGYITFAFLGDIRNDWKIPSIASGRGIGEERTKLLEEHENSYNKDMDDWVIDRGYEYVEWICGSEGYSVGQSWVLLSELLDYDYAQIITNKQESGLLNPINQWTELKLRDFLSENFFLTVNDLKKRYLDYSPEDVRLFFCFCY